MKTPLFGRRNTLILGAISIILGAGAVSAWATIQFYQANRGARLVVYLKAKREYSARDHVVVTVLLCNQTTTPMLVNCRMRPNRYPLDGEISFVIKGPKDKEFKLQKAVSPRDILDSELTVLNVGQTSEQEVDLTDLYGLNKRGEYRVQVLYYNRTDLEKDGLKLWRGVIASEPAEIVLK